MRLLLAAAVALACSGCATVSPTPNQTPPAREVELRAIRANPGQSVGFGDKAFVPWMPNVAHFLISYDDPAVTRRLLAELRAPSFHTQDFVLAAIIRLTGPQRFRFRDPRRADLVGCELPRLDDATRADLLDDAREIR